MADGVRVVGFVSAVVVLIFAVVAIVVEPDVWILPPLADEDTQSNTFTSYETRNDLMGAEAFTQDAQNVIYSGLVDGRVVRIDPDTGVVETVIRIGDGDDAQCSGGMNPELCGRPLGLVVNPLKPDSELYVCDGDKRGLMVVDFVQRTKRVLFSEADGQPILFCNAVVALPSGLVIITQSSAVHPVAEAMQEIIGGQPSGRVVMFNVKTKETRTLAKGVSFANGLILIEDGKSLLYSDMLSGKLIELTSREGNETVEDALLNGRDLKKKIYKRVPILIDNLTHGFTKKSIIAATTAERSVATSVLLQLGFGRVLRRLPVHFLLWLSTLNPPNPKLVEIDTSTRRVVRIINDPNRGGMAFVSEGFLPVDAPYFNGRLILGSYRPDRPTFVAKMDSADDDVVVLSE